VTAEIQRSWVGCDECGLPVIYRDNGIAVDAAIGGRYGEDQVDTDVEHECDPWLAGRRS